MTTVRTICIIVVLLFAPALARAAIGDQLLVAGQSTAIAVDFPIADVALSHPSVADYLVAEGGRSLHISARGGGESTITLWDESGAERERFTVRVVTTTLKEVLERARGAFGDLSGVRIAIRDGRVEIGGEVSWPEDYRQIESLARADPRIRNRARLVRDVIDETAEAIRRSIDVPGVQVKAVQDRIVLGGVAYSAADAKRAVEIARLAAPEVLDLIEVRETGRVVGRGRMVELTFHMMEVKRGALTQLGVQWTPGAFPANGNASASAGGLLESVGAMGRAIIGFAMNFLPKLKHLNERGRGRVLENPSVVVKSGEKARLFSGSEVPYYKGEEVQFKKVGIEIEAWPIETAAGVDLQLAATVSAPAADLRGALDTHTVQTTAICRAGQSVILGNIVRNTDVKMRNRLPRDVDTSTALWTLMLSKDFQSHRSEFVIVVTPRVIDAAPSAEAQLRDFLATEERMIRDRSEEEFAEHVARRDGVTAPARPAVEEATPRRMRRKRRHKWD